MKNLPLIPLDGGRLRGIITIATLMHPEDAIRYEVC
jgi:hypothetical protein